MYAGRGISLVLLLSVTAHAALVDDPVLFSQRKQQIAVDARMLVASAPANGDFSDGLTSWTTEGVVTAAGGTAVLTDQVQPTSLLFQPVALTPGTYLFQFDVFSNLAPGPGTGSFPDTFFASLYFTSDPNTFDIRSGSFSDVTPLLDVDADGYVPAVGAVAPSPLGGDWVRYTVTFENTYSYVVPAFELADIDGTAGNSEVRIDNVSIVVPEPSTLLLAMAGLAVLAVRRARRGAALLVLALGVPAAWGQTPQSLRDHFVVRTANERSTLDRQTGEIVSTVDVTLMNLGGREVRTSLYAVVNLSTGNVTVVGALGGPTAAPYNRYYFDLSPRLTAGRLAANEGISFPLTFRRNRETVITYDIEAFGLLKEEQAPLLVLPPGPYFVHEGGLLELAVSGTDPDGDVVTLAGRPAVSNASFGVTAGTNATGLFTFQPRSDQAGVYAVQFSATDPLGLTSVSNITVVVSNVNQAPVVPPLPLQVVDEGGLLTLSLGIADPDGDPLTITPVGLPTNAVFNPGAQTFFWSPDFEQAGSYDLQFEACDAALCRTQSLAITVRDVPSAPPGDTNTFALNVDPVQSPTLQTRLRVRGNVNGSTNGPAAPPFTTALISGVVPSTGEQGSTLDVTLTGPGSGPFAIHFIPGESVPTFGEGIGVNGITVLSPTQLVANITLHRDAAIGPRAPSVQTANEFAPSIVAFSVQRGETSLSGNVVDFNTTNGIFGAIVSIEGTGISTTAGSNGVFTLHNIPPGPQVLVINAPNHELIRVVINAQDPGALDLGLLAARALVYDPGAPASLSLLSVLGRGLGAFSDVTNLEELQKSIRDGLLLVGGDEAGVLDEFGNQLNPAVDGAGLWSMEADGVRQLAERMSRKDSVALEDLLLPVSFAMEWSKTNALTLRDWVDGMQDELNQAWANPDNPGSYLPILLFNRGRQMSVRPPQLSPETRLNAVQSYLLCGSLWSYVFATNRPLAFHAPVPSLRSFWDAVVPSAYADPPPAPAARWTQYWRNMFANKQNFIQQTLNAAYTSYIKLAAIQTAAMACPDLRGQLIALPLLGYAANDLGATLGVLSFLSIVPEPPRDVMAETVQDVDGKTRVVVSFRRSSSDKNDGSYLYSLYRFGRPADPRAVVTFSKLLDAGLGTISNSAVYPTLPRLSLTDPNPPQGTWFYALTLTRLFSVNQTISITELAAAQPWWNYPLSGATDPFQILGRSKRNMTSDYSEPATVRVGPPAADAFVTDLAVDLRQDDVIVADRSSNVDSQRFVRIAQQARGARSVAAVPYFKTPGYQGLAADASGNLYSENAASDSQFGGRVFKFDAATGARDFVGSLNYFSRDLAFANPVQAGPMAIGPAASGGSAQDLYVVDEMVNQVKRVPVSATYDPFRRVGQPFATIPLSGTPVDLDVQDDRNAYLLLNDGTAREESLSRFHPEEVKGGDPVDLESGSFSTEIMDMLVPSRAGMQIIRTYSSLNTNVGPFGPGWDYSYGYRAEATNDALGARHVLVNSGAGVAFDFIEQPDGSFKTPAGWWYYLVRTNGGYRMTDKTGSAILFNTNGWLTRLETRQGDGLDVSYLPPGTNDWPRIERISDGQGKELSFTYNEQRLVTRVQDHRGFATTYGYDALGRLAAWTNPVGAATRCDYDGAGRLTRMTNPRGVDQLLHTYSASGRVTRQIYNGDAFNFSYAPNATTVTDRRGASHTQVYDDQGGLVKLIDQLGRVSEFVRNPQLLVTDVVLPDGSTTHYDYDPRGNLVRNVNPMGAAYELTYDPRFDRVSRIRDPLGRETQYVYDDAGNVLAVVDAIGRTNRFFYDAHGLVTNLVNSRGDGLVMEYSAQGKLRATQSLLTGDRFEMDDNETNRLVLRSNRFTNELVVTYDALERPVAYDAPDGTTRVAYDGLDLLTNVTYPNGDEFKLRYDIYGRMTGLQTPDTNELNFMIETGARYAGYRLTGEGESLVYHDLAGRATSIVDLAGGVFQYSYDARDNLTAVRDANTNTSTFTYDRAGHLLENHGYDGTTEWFAYDAIGAITAMSNNRGFACSMSADAVARLTNVTYFGAFAKSLSFDYDERGFIAQRRDADRGATRYAYDARGALVSLTNAAGQGFRIGYNAAGVRTNLVFPNGVRTEYVYRPTAPYFLTRVDTVASNGALLARAEFGLDGEGRRVALADENGQTNRYAYDSADRLTRVDFPGGDFRAYTYNGQGRRIAEARPGVTNSFGYDAAGHLVSAHGETFSYDGNGNLVRRQRGAQVTAYTYDFDQRLIRIVHPDAKVTTYAYGPFGQRISKTHDGRTVLYLYDGANLIEERDTNGVVLAEYTHGEFGDEVLARRQGGQTVYFHLDGLNNVVLLTDAAGQPVKRYAYEPFGALRSESGTITNDVQYIGCPRDPESGLVYMGFRYYDPTIGQYLTPEPRYRHALSYGYACNSPLLWRDPSGLSPVPQPRDRQLVPNGNVTAVRAITQLGIYQFVSQLSDQYFPQFYSANMFGKHKTFNNHFNGAGLLRVVSDDIEVVSGNLRGAYRWVHVDTTHSFYTHVHLPTADLSAFLQSKNWKVSNFSKFVPMKDLLGARLSGVLAKGPRFVSEVNWINLNPLHNLPFPRAWGTRVGLAHAPGFFFQALPIIDALFIQQTPEKKALAAAGGIGGATGSALFAVIGGAVADGPGALVMSIGAGAYGDSVGRSWVDYGMTFNESFQVPAGALPGSP